MFPVEIRRLKISNNLDGDCQFKNNKFVIRINRNLLEHEAVETVIHEFAHVIAWEKCKSEVHSNEWGKAYSLIYRTFLKNLE